MTDGGFSLPFSGPGSRPPGFGFGYSAPGAGSGLYPYPNLTTRARYPITRDLRPEDVFFPPPGTCGRHLPPENVCSPPIIRSPYAAPCEFCLTFALLHAAPPHLHLCTASLSDPPSLRASAYLASPSPGPSSIPAQLSLPLSTCHRAHVSPPQFSLR